MTDIALAAADRLLRKANAKRVTNEAVEELRDILEEIALEIARKAVILGTHAKRKTVSKEDVKLAYKRWRSGQ
ncbi:MAG: histone family protein [Candidatus Hodarchaeales archaeon]